METYHLINHYIDNNLISCLPAIVLWLVVLRLFLKTYVDFAKAFCIVKWIIIGYASIVLIMMPIREFVFHETVISNRANGQYGFIYWFLFSSTVLLPFTLLFKKLGNSPFYIVFIAIMLRIGYLFELFVITVTGLHRDSYTEDTTSLLIFAFSIVFLQAFIIALFILGVVKLFNMPNKNTLYKFNNINAIPWDILEKRFSNTSPKQTFMIELIKHIRSTGLADTLFGTTSLNTLVISNHTPFNFQKEALHITYDTNTNKWHFAYFSQPYQKPEFERTYEQLQGIEKFTNFIQMIGW